MIAGQRLPSGCGYSTIMPDMDFETYSEAGYIWNDGAGWYVAPKGATKKGIKAVGAAVYTEHPSAEVLCLAYDLKDGRGERLWAPGAPAPNDLFDHIARGGLLEAWNCGFEYWVWKNICVPKLGWPELPFWQLRDAMAKANAHALPGTLADAAKVVGAPLKIEDGKRLLNKFSVLRKPTKNNPAHRIRPEDDPEDAAKLYAYCLGDIKSEAGISQQCPDLSPEELDFWLCTFAANTRGLGLDMPTVRGGSQILDAALDRYNAELSELTGGAVGKASEVQKLTVWLASQGVNTRSLDADALERLLGKDLPPDARRAIEIRQLVGSAGVKKIYAMERMASRAGRAHDLIVYHRARTGRDGGQDIQPQNLVKSGPQVLRCDGCETRYGIKLAHCPECGALAAYATTVGWSWEAVDRAAEIIRTGDLDAVEQEYGDALLTLSGCIRGCFIPAPGHDFIASDYSSIEAVVTAVLAGEKWRIDAFERKDDIYLRSASGITGIPYEEYRNHPDGPKGHPDRQKIGKPAELGLGFGGWIGAWRKFDSSDNFTDEQVKQNIIAWRESSPAVVELWGGQVRGKPWAPDYAELHGLEGMAIAAVQNPGTCYNFTSAYNPFGHSGITYGVKGDVLYCRLPSGRLLTYHKPRLHPSERWEGQLSLSFEGYNSNPQMGPVGWIRIDTYGGRLAENAIQAAARDYMRDGVVRLERAGYPHVLRVHDEIVCEVPEGTGDIEQFERLMGQAPPWAAGWPIRAEGGWRGKRYRKD